MSDLFVAGFRDKIEGKLSISQVEMVCRALEQYSFGFNIEPVCTAVTPAVFTFPREIDLFLAVKKQDGKMTPKSREQYDMCLRDMHLFLRKPIREITTLDLRIYLDHASKNRITGEPIATGTLNQRKNIIRPYFQWLYEEEIIPKNVAIKIHPERDNAEPRTAFSDEELERIRRACKTLRDKAIVDLLASSGLRISELCSLNKEDIDFEHREFKVFGKGAKWRTAFLNARAIVSIREYLNTRTDDSEALFILDRAPHLRVKPNGVRRMLHELSEDSGVPDIIPHRFRHTVATAAINVGMPVESVQKVLGHERIETTMRYAHVSTEKVKEDYRRYIR